MIRMERRERDGQWAELQVSLEDGKLSIKQTSGQILSPADAAQQALDSWATYFEDQAVRDELALRVRRFFDTALEAAQYVVDTDGVLHGLEVHDLRDGKVYIAEASGAPTAEWFPEAMPHVKWHLNDMNAGCEHQDALGWGRGRDVALDRASCTAAQLAALDGDARLLAEQAQQKAVEVALEAFREDLQTRRATLVKILGRTPTLYDMTSSALPTSRSPQTAQRVREYFAQRAAEEHPPVPFRSQVFTDCLGAPCPTCGVRYGHSWLRRELPADTVAWATAFGASAE